MKDNRKNRKKCSIFKCDKCGFSFRAFRVPHVNILVCCKVCPMCGSIPIPF